MSHKKPSEKVCMSVPGADVMMMITEMMLLCRNCCTVRVERDQTGLETPVSQQRGVHTAHAGGKCVHGVF